MIPNISPNLSYHTAPSIEKVKNDFSEIIGKLGKEEALEKCRAIVKSQKNGEDALVVAKVFYQLFPSEKQFTFEFIDKSTLSLSPHVLEALKKDSELIGSLFEDAEGTLIPLTVLSKAQFLGILKVLYPDEPFENGSEDLGDLLIAANYLNLERALTLNVERAFTPLTTRLHNKITSLKDKNDFEEALKLHNMIQNFPSEFRDKFDMSYYFGRVLEKADPDEREKLIDKYNEMNITALSFLGNPKAKELLASLSKIKSLNTLKFQMLDLDASDIKLLPQNLLNLEISFCKIKDEHIPLLPRNLNSLNLSGNEISDEGIGQLNQSNLKDLNLSQCIKITNTGVARLPQSLTSLNLSDCVKVSDGGVALLPKTLDRLYLERCFQITDKGIASLPKKLTVLNLYFCDSITDKGIDSLPPTLKKLNIAGCRKVTIATQTRLRQKGLL